MKCVIPGVNVKVFGRSVHSLAKIGDELYIEPLQHGLSIRTVNSSRSAYACFLYSPSFFQIYNDGNSKDSDSEDEKFKCKLSIKSVLSVFKSLSTLVKTVERCKITAKSEEARIIFQLHCKYGIVKTHSLTFIECETLQAVFSKDMSPNMITAPSRLLHDTVSHFHPSQEEVTLSVNPNSVVLRNHIEEEIDSDRIMRTAHTFEPSEFDNLRIGIDTEITFCLKELRAVLAFSEAGNLPVTINFETAGKPIVFTLNSDPTFDANFVLATLADVSASQSSQSHSSAAKTPRNSVNRNSVSSVQRPRQNTTKTSHSSTVKKDIPPKRISKPAATNDGNSNHSSHNYNASEDIRLLTKDAGDNWDEDLESQIGDTTTVRPSTSKEKSPLLNKNIPQKPTTIVLSDDDSNDKDLDETIPGTPPAKKFKSSLFFGFTSQSTQGSAASTQPKGPVLASDSEED